MRHMLRLSACVGFVVTLVLAGNRCSPAARRAPPGPLTRSVSTVYPGTPDHANRYLPGVQVRTAKEVDTQSGCSGVLISRRLVVTAGHCVCMKREIVAGDAEKAAKAVEKAFSSRSKQEKEAILAEVLGKAHTIIDGSRCADFTIAALLAYSPPAATEADPEDDLELDYSVKERSGSIRAHPNLLVLYDEQGLTLFKDTDLATIVLRKPLQEEAPPVKLAQAEIQDGAPVIMVGYGPGDNSRGAKEYGDRYYGEGRVVRVARSDSGDVQFHTGHPAGGNLAASVDAGDSGGPCFSKADATVLLGIASAYTLDDEGSKLSIFTSVYPHRKWLQQVAREAGEVVH